MQSDTTNVTLALILRVYLNLWNVRLPLDAIKLFVFQCYRKSDPMVQTELCFNVFSNCKRIIGDTVYAHVYIESPKMYWLILRFNLQMVTAIEIFLLEGYVRC